MTLDTQQQRLERLIGAGLSGQPPLKAPASLQARVLAEIARRAALPWWQRSIRHWPLMVQLAFFVTALAAGRVLLSSAAWSGASQAASRLSASIASPLSWLQTLAGACMTLGSLLQRASDLVVHQVPALWLYGGIGALVAMYVTLAGIGVTVYRSLDNA